MNKSRNKKNNKMTDGKLSKLGADTRWKERLDTLQELYEVMPHGVYVHITHASTVYLKILLKAYLTIPKHD